MLLGPVSKLTDSKIADIQDIKIAEYDLQTQQLTSNRNLPTQPRAPRGPADFLNTCIVYIIYIYIYI